MAKNVQQDGARDQAPADKNMAAASAALAQAHDRPDNGDHNAALAQTSVYLSLLALHSGFKGLDQPTSARDIAAQVTALAEKNPDIMKSFGDEQTFRRTMQNIANLDTTFESKGGLYFHAGSTPAETADAFTKIHIEQYRETGRPSLTALAAHHLDEIGLSPENPHYKAAMLVAARAEMEHAVVPQYHNQFHYADVTAQTAEFLKRNNHLADTGTPGAQKLSPEEMADSITAALGHDLDHPGGKNALPGESAPSNVYRLEDQSFKAMEPLLKEAGLGEKNIADIHTMVQTTSPDGPHGILKAVAKAQREGQPVEWEKIDPNNKYPELKVLSQDPKLAARAAALEDADLGGSAFEGLKSNIRLSDDFTNELQERGYRNKAGNLEDLRGDNARAGFFKFVVGDEGPASAGARATVGQNYADLQNTTSARIAFAKAAAPAGPNPPTPAPVASPAAPETPAPAPAHMTTVTPATTPEAVAQGAPPATTPPALAQTTPVAAGIAAEVLTDGIKTEGIILNERPGPSAVENPFLKPSAGADAVAAGASIMNVVAGTKGTIEAIENKDAAGIAVNGSTALLGVAGTALPIMKIAGQAVPEAVEGALGKANIGVMVAQGVYQIAKEDTTLHKEQRAAAVVTQSGIALGLGTAGATAGEATALTGVVGTGGAAVATAAAPVVLTMAAVVATGVVAEKSIENARIREKTAQDSDKAFKAEKLNLPQNTGQLPSIYQYKNLPAVGYLLKNTLDSQLNGHAERTADGYIKNLRQLDMSDPKNLKAYEDAINRKMQQNKQTIDQSESGVNAVIPNFIRWDDKLKRADEARIEQKQLQGAKDELALYKNDLKAYEDKTAQKPTQSASNPPARDHVSDGGIRSRNGSLPDLTPKYNAAAQGQIVAQPYNAPQPPASRNRPAAAPS